MPKSNLMKLLITILICTLISVGYAFAQKEKPRDTEQVSAKVIRTIDGDTISVQIGDKYEKVRMIGVDTPELKDERPRVQCFAIAAKMYTEDHLDGLTVQLEADPTQADRDRYGRLLRYVWWNKDLYNRYIIKKGFAYEYTYGKPYKYQKEFKEAQKYAEESKWGLWDENECK